MPKARRATDATLPPHPMQPIVLDEQGVPRFRANPLIQWILEENRAGRVVDLNTIASNGWRDLWTDDDQAQLAQLIGYSVSGAADLEYFSDELYERATEEADRLEQKKPT